ncbi:hypothetical protein X777_06500, partial [Ooceraea biroi]
TPALNESWRSNETSIGSGYGRLSTRRDVGRCVLHEEVVSVTSGISAPENSSSHLTPCSRVFAVMLAELRVAINCPVTRTTWPSSVSMETAKMYISNEPQNGHHGHPTTKYASTNSIPAMMEEESSLAKILGAVGKQRENAAILRETKVRRHSVLEDLKARRDSLFQRARRASVFDEKSNVKDNAKNSDKDKSKEKRRSSSDTSNTRRGSVFYVSEDLLEENQDVLENEDRARAAQEAKKGRRKSWHPLAKPPKVDRKRKKGVSGIPMQGGSTEGLYTAQNYTRQKRPSWWNIFVPDSVTRIFILKTNEHSYNLQTVSYNHTSVSHRRATSRTVFPRWLRSRRDQYHTVRRRYVDYVILTRLRHKVTRLVAQIEFILCEFPEPHLVKTTLTAGRVSVSADNVVPEQPDCHTYTHIYTNLLCLSFLHKVCLLVTEEFGVYTDPSSRTTSFILAVPERLLNESTRMKGKNISPRCCPMETLDARPTVSSFTGSLTEKTGESSSSFYRISFVPATDRFRVPADSTMCN